MADDQKLARFNPAVCRRDFPILTEKVYGNPLVYLDSASSAQKPAVVIQAEKDLYEHYYANVHRGVYKFSQDATEAFETTRKKVVAFIHARSEKECLFVRGATEGINLVAQSWGRTNISTGDEIIVSEIEHHSNIVPWQLLAAEKGATIKVIPVLSDGSLDIETYHSLLGERTKLVAVTHISNSIGTITPIKEIIRAAHSAGAVVCVDGCQGAPHVPLDMQALDADFYAFSAHKMYGPSGIGILYGKEELLEAMPPWQGGGDMIDRVSFAGTSFNDLPYKFEAGTPNIAGGIAFGSAIDYLSAINWQDLHAHEMALLDYTTSKLKEFNTVRIIGEASDKISLISFIIDDIHPHDVGTILDRQGIAVRVGHHCAQPVMDHFGITGTVRASFGLYNTQDDANRLIDGVKKVISLFG